MGGPHQGVIATWRTARLTLRPPTAADAATIFATYAADPEATRYMSWPRHEKLSSTEWFISFAAHEWATYGTGTYLAFAGDTLIGSTGLHVDKERAGVVATGYILGTAYWGQGYATETCRAMVDVARRRGDRRVEAYCHADHAASARVLEKAGLRFEGVVRDHVVFPNLSPALQDVRFYALDLGPDLGVSRS